MDLPQDIIDSVIAAAGNDTRVLKQCALVSSSFLLPSRKHLFSRITLRSDQSCQGIHQFFVQNPVIQSSVRSITLTENSDKWSPKFTEWMNGTSLLAILQLTFCHLESFSITEHRRSHHWSWDSFSGELKDAISNIIHSPTLKTLFLKGITRVPITIFLHIGHLTTLRLQSISPIDFCDDSSLTRAASKGMAPIASHTVIDRCVWGFGQTHAWYEIPFICLFLNN